MFTEEDSDDSSTLLESNDPLYDDVADHNDDAWLKEKLKLVELRSGRQTDAVLSCPMCFVVFTFDCQRHAYYKNQFRAMFVEETCQVVIDQILKCIPEKDQNVVEEQVLHPVRCRQCGVEVAVYDQDEVYHFFNVIHESPYA